MPVRHRSQDFSEKSNQNSSSTDVDTHSSSSSRADSFDDPPPRSQCSCPTGCIAEKQEDPEESENPVRVICDNPSCPESQFMHAACFDYWEETLLAKSSRRRLDKRLLWSRKGYEQVYKTCICKCGGHLRKDLEYTHETPLKEEIKKRPSKKRKPLPTMDRMRTRSSTWGSPSAPIEKYPGSNCSHPDTHGNIFRRRTTLDTLMQVLPKWKLNGYHIKREDDCPQGNDEYRCFVLTTLGDRKLRECPCLLCHRSIPVYDRYPLIDGTFFLSLKNHSNKGVEVKWEGVLRFLHSICVVCLESSPGVECAKCGEKGWFRGDCLQIGTMYAYDVLSAFQCCTPRCLSCMKSFPSEFRTYYSQYGERIVCQRCGQQDFHFAKEVEQLRMCA